MQVRLFTSLANTGADILLTMHPTLLVGRYDWDPERLPKSEFLERIDAFWRKIPDSTCSAAVVYGDSRNHAELSYLSNFVPKLGPALMLIPRKGAPKLLVSGAPNMLPAAQRLTWIERLQPLRDAGKTIIQWLGESAGSIQSPSPRDIALIAGDSMRSALYRSLSEAFGVEYRLSDATSALRTLMRFKRRGELAIIREACAILRAAANALTEAKSAGGSVTAAILEAERIAHRSGAQDVRTLFSLDGGRTLRPFEELIDDRVDPLQAYVAVRHAGYWVEGFIVLAASQHPALAKAAGALQAVIKTATAGTKCRDLVHLAEEMIRPYRSHIMTAGNIGNSIGLSLEEEPRLLGDSEERLEAGCVYALRVGASEGQEHHAIVSAMITAQQHGNELLWSAV
jgi:Xaa-Pro aminopeptidase